MNIDKIMFGNDIQNKLCVFVSYLINGRQDKIKY